MLANRSENQRKKARSDLSPQDPFVFYQKIRAKLPLWLFLVSMFLSAQVPPRFLYHFCYTVMSSYCIDTSLEQVLYLGESCSLSVC